MCKIRMMNILFGLFMIVAMDVFWADFWKNTPTSFLSSLTVVRILSAKPSIFHFLYLLVSDVPTRFNVTNNFSKTDIFQEKLFEEAKEKRVRKEGR